MTRLEVFEALFGAESMIVTPEWWLEEVDLNDIETKAAMLNDICDAKKSSKK